MLWSTIKTSCKTYRSKTYNKKGGVSLIDKDCKSCKQVSTLLVDSSTVIFAKENGRRIMCNNNHIVFNGLDVE